MHVCPFTEEKKRDLDTCFISARRPHLSVLIVYLEHHAASSALMPCDGQVLMSYPQCHIVLSLALALVSEGTAHVGPPGRVIATLFSWPPQELRQYLSHLADQCNSENNAVEMPLVIILDNLHHVSSLGEIFNGLLNCKYHKW